MNMQVEDRLTCGHSVGLNDVHAVSVRCFDNSRSNSTGCIRQIMCLALANHPDIWSMRRWNHKRMTEHCWNVRQESHDFASAPHLTSWRSARNDRAERAPGRRATHARQAPARS